TAIRGAHRHVRTEMRIDERCAFDEVVAVSPPRRDAYAEQALVAAVTAGVISASSATLIERTRLEHVSLGSVATSEGSDYETVRMRRRRAEERLVAWLREEPLSGSALDEAVLLMSESTGTEADLDHGLIE